MEKHPLVKEVLYTQEQIIEAAKKVANQVDKYYQTQKIKDHTVLIIGLLKGSIPFLAEFMKHLTCEVETDYMVVSSYQGGTKSSGESKIVLDVNTALKDRHVLIVEDVIDSGITLDYIKSYLDNRGVRDIKILTMIDKTFRRQKTVAIDWSCFQDDSAGFLVGFGLDYQERLRNLPYIGIIDKDKLNDWKW